MYKFKFDPPQEHRRSLNYPKNEHVAIINTLDKCTQIVREDRLWLRNEIKNNNSEVLAFFKQYPRSTQLQHLQIKLRKYVQGVKSRIKQEQLCKFRETLQLQSQSQMPYASKPNTNSVSKPHNQSVSRYPLNQSASKTHLKSNSSLQMNKTTQFRPNRSQQMTRPSQVNMSSSLKHFQDMLKYKCSHDVIEERESQNVTSARLGRQEHQNHGRPLQELSYSSNMNKNALLNPFFNKEHSQERSSHEIKLKSINKFSNQLSEKLNAWEFEKKAKQTLYQQQFKFEQNQKQFQGSSQGYGSRFNPDECEEREESIMDKHFTESEKISHRDGPQINQNQAKNDYKSTYELKQSTFSNYNDYKTKQGTLNQGAQSDKNNEQNLFTPLELLNQCRSFLKNRQSSTKKSFIKPVQEHNFKNETFKSLEIVQFKSKQQQSSECLFTRNNKKELPNFEAIAVDKKEEEEQQQQSPFMFPEGKSPQQQTPLDFNSTMKNVSVVSYPHFDTFAHISNEKMSFQKALSPPQPINTEEKPVQEESVPALSVKFSIQDFLEDLMQQTQMKPFIEVGHLAHYLQNHSQDKALISILAKYLDMVEEEQICLTSIAQQINLAYNSQHKKEYPHNDSKINSVYDLLDIDQKGYIVREDVNSFLEQLQDAQVQNYDEVSSQMFGLFEGSDFTNQKRITYWHFYLIKQSDQFERVSQLLGQFQFEIEREA